MKKLIYLPLLLLLVLNCYLTDLEEYKQLEKHNDNINLYGIPSTYLEIDRLRCQLIELNFQFSIKRVVHYDFFLNNDTSEQIPISLIHIKSDNGKEIPRGEHSYENQILYDPAICSDIFTIRIQAISDVDTLVEYFHLTREVKVHCNKGGVDSNNIRLRFGKDSTICSYINTGNFDESVLVGNRQNLVIITKFSQAFNKPYIMVMDSNKVTDELSYDFVAPKNIDSLSSYSQHSLIYSFYEYNVQSKYIDREFLCSIRKKNGYYYADNAICEISSGKQYALIYSKYLQNEYFIYLLKVCDMVYDNNHETGYADCVLYTLN
jgi:hypothetical protein